MPVILYAEFTAKPGSESQVQTLIRAEYGVIFNQQFSSLIEEGASQLTFLMRSDPP